MHPLVCLVAVQIGCSYSMALSERDARRKIKITCCLYNNPENQKYTVSLFALPLAHFALMILRMPPLLPRLGINKCTESTQLPLRPVYWNAFSLHFWRTAGSTIDSNFPCACEANCEWFQPNYSTVTSKFAWPSILSINSFIYTHWTFFFFR